MSRAKNPGLPDGLAIPKPFLRSALCGGIGEWDKDVFDPITLSWEGSIPYGDYEAKRPEAEALAAHYLCQLVESPSDGGTRQVPLEQAKKVVANGLLRYRGRQKKNDPSYDIKSDGREIWWREYHVVATMNDDSEHVTYDFRVSRTGTNTYQVSQKFS